ncbi:GNAT family N-acetyltransferase [Chelativorans salis]|uniref:GNAT family N-acetyltransferase n=1 Tax=Chelativorans salis TaxID=2978478 RepID=A0ABT2LKU1_9HYPH|nr:GNAT family N-acetyltransferase [Chelativorans sp. EGI FJ00035]MCT7374013.1 GNAT family N-acetyltransferase [Chelativorans sp. EGI FJ00035]
MTRNEVSDLTARMKLTSPQVSGSSEYITEWRGVFENAEVNALHAECFKHRVFADDWWSQVNRFSLGWVCTRRSGKLVGFVNVAWDGGVHAFILDTMVAPAFQRQGIATALIVEAVDRAKRTGCEWLHVDFEPHLRPFYFDACGFSPSDAGLVALK